MTTIPLPAEAGSTLVADSMGLAAFPAIFRAGIRKMGIENFLRLAIQPAANEQKEKEAAGS